MSEMLSKERLVSPGELAAFLGVPVQTVYGWRCRGGGPRGYRIGKHVRYRWADVEGWLATRGDDVADGDIPRGMRGPAVDTGIDGGGRGWFRESVRQSTAGRPRA